MLPDGLSVRHPLAADHPRIQAVLAGWWGDLGGAAGRLERALLVPRLYLQHFTDTSFVVERADGTLGAFLIGFRSQSRPDVAYIHFVGVAPDLRRMHVAAALYEGFIEEVRATGARRVQSCTSPSNTTSKAFHTSLGFAIDPSDEIVDGVPVQRDYDGPGIDRVTFTLTIA
jgi:predicted GNAT superfamily acetyltransferase